MYGPGNCPTGTVWDSGIQACVSPKSPVGQRALGDQWGEAVKGRYGAALVPATRTVTTSYCPPGAVLGKDGFCYNRRDLRKDERKWNPGTPPLLTGGDVNAIRKAKRAAGRLERKTKALQSMGMIKKPAPRTKRLHAHAHAH